MISIVHTALEKISNDFVFFGGATTALKIFSEPYFLASKLEAFKGRGAGDFRLSQDMEDIITVLEGSLNTTVELDKAPEPVNSYLKKEF